MLLKTAKCYEGLRNYEDAIQCLIEILTFVREYGDADDDWLAKKRTVSDPGFYEQIYAALTRCYEAKSTSFEQKRRSKKRRSITRRTWQEINQRGQQTIIRSALSVGRIHAPAEVFQISFLAKDWPKLVTSEN